jgi:hypothetical protein
MEANSNNSSSMVRFSAEAEIYSGVFNKILLNKFINNGVFEVIDTYADSTRLLMNNRDDFLNGFASGVNEAN